MSSSRLLVSSSSPHFCPLLLFQDALEHSNLAGLSLCCKPAWSLSTKHFIIYSLFVTLIFQISSHTTVMYDTMTVYHNQCILNMVNSSNHNAMFLFIVVWSYGQSTKWDSGDTGCVLGWLLADWVTSDKPFNLSVPHLPHL